eukprot:2827553-Ditylum_brightwellii.AAC.1
MEPSLKPIAHSDVGTKINDTLYGHPLVNDREHELLNKIESGSETSDDDDDDDDETQDDIFNETNVVT